MLRSFFSIFFSPFFPFWGGGGVGGGVNLLTVYLLSPLHLLVCSRLVLVRELDRVCIRNFVCLRRWLIAWFHRGGSRFFQLGRGAGGGWMITIGHQTDTSNYFKLSYVFPKTWRFRKNEDWLASQGLCGSRIYIYFLGPTCLRLFLHVLYFLVGCSKGGGTPLDSPLLPSPPSPPNFYQPKQNMLINRGFAK